MKPCIKNILAAGLVLIAFTITSRAAVNDWVPLGLAEQAAYSYTHVLTLDATNCTGNVSNAANGTYNTLFPKVNDGTVTFPAGTRIGRVGLYVEKAFATSDGAASYALNIGDSTVTNRYVSAAAIGTNVGTGVLETNLSTGLIGYNAGLWVEVDKGTNRTYNTGTNLTFHLLGPALNSALTSGRVQIYIEADGLWKLRQ